VILTRRPEDNAALATELRARGREVIELPCVRNEPLADTRALASAIAALSPSDLVVLTSRAGVAAVSVDPSWRIACAVAAIGRATADAARAAGLRVTFVATHADSGTLARELPLPRGEVVLARSDLADDELPARLRERGARVREFVAYRTVPEISGDIGPARDALENGPVIVVASPSAVEALAGALPLASLQRATFVAIGERTARRVRERIGASAVIATDPDITALLDAIAPLEEVAR
jgi:uroporphyrinogen III methyltransferase/synthase